MPRIDFRTPRLYIDAPLVEGATVVPDRAQAHYLTHVLRLGEGRPVLLFNGRDGEWRTVLAPSKRGVTLAIAERTRSQDRLPDVRYVFAPIKHARLDYMVQKAVELGVRALLPVVTQHSQVTRLNLERMRANVVEAAEQCGILNLATVEPAVPLARFLDDRHAGEASRLLVFCDEDAEAASPLALLANHRAAGGGIDVLIGPEGGFSDEERTLLLRQENLCRLPLGPRILRADTAAIASLTLVMTVLGDWGGQGGAATIG
jgi:16S rRNA (uracil1498-N3)-methyltransferase